MTPAIGPGIGEERAEGAGAFAVELPVFTGPFRLLADLILGQKLDVCDVPIATVTDRFLAHAKEADGWSLEEATWFLAVCAIMLELKVGRLMPRHEVLDEEDLLGVSPDLVYARSLELAAFRLVARGSRAPHRGGEPAAPARGRPAAGVRAPVPRRDGGRRGRATSRASRRPCSARHRCSISRTSRRSATRWPRRWKPCAAHLDRLGQASFRDLVADCDEKIQVVVRFLALLDLYRDGKVELAQAETFGEIRVRWEGA